MLDQGEDLTTGRVPDRWAELAPDWPQSVGSFVDSLARKLKYMDKWVKTEEPRVHWLPAYWLPRCLFNSVLIT